MLDPFAGRGLVHSLVATVPGPLPVVECHRSQSFKLGFRLEGDVEVPTARVGFGANGSARVSCEHIMNLRKR